ncbi:hypothetical protein [Methylococcus mesophilus]|uniref:hypothetical protein n=1 Tax=Methylococcus mesophilus TaxID=2993564 RepID=UPI00224AB203|nr:hypothetical protein [Methylococcus mesophilus]UZR30913.1 hypothetical protein OOT43_09860 [Methylococcus mesophilus]
MARLILVLLWAVVLAPLVGAGDLPDAVKDPKWWEKREKRTDIRYPHNAHMEVMDEEGDSCMLCHSFAPNAMADESKLKPLTTISNEPLKAVCHDCHVTEQRGPWRCNLCHDDKTKIWPEDHRFGYIDHHGEAARRDEAACKECHLDLAFCTNCHFRRDTMGTGYHPLGYRTLHGLSVKVDTLDCGRCHNQVYCETCHARTRYQ